MDALERITPISDCWVVIILAILCLVLFVYCDEFVK